MPDLIVNVDYAAALRNWASSCQPDPAGVAMLAEMAGAAGIFARLAAKNRPTSNRDIRVLRETVQGRFSLGAPPTAEMMGLILEAKPDAVIFMPERPEKVSDESGLDLILNRRAIADTLATIRDSGIPVFLRIDPDPEHVKIAHRLNADGVQINTRTYAGEASASTRRRMLARIVDTVRIAARLKLSVSCGGGLDYQTCRPLGLLKEVEACVIGHSLMARALLAGMEPAVRDMIIALGGR